MIKSSPKFLLVVFSFLFAIIVAFEIVVYMKLTTSTINWDGVMLGFVASLFTSICMLVLIHAIVFKKINSLLASVKRFRKRSDKSYTKIEYGDNEIENLSQEILAWAKDRDNEIELLKKLEVYRKEFLGNVSHELKTPVFNIQGYVLTLLEGGIDDETINRKYLGRAEKSIDRMISIIEDLEAISQLETGELELELERFDVVTLVRDIVDDQELRATAKGIILSLPKDIQPFFVIADKFRIRQVIVNLIVNSIKYGKEYGETKIRFYDQGSLVFVEIADNGAGISEEHLPRLFERFYRVDKSRSRDQGGTGLGLSIVKHIMEAHNQDIRAISTKKTGTVFTFTLDKY